MKSTVFLSLRLEISVSEARLVEAVSLVAAAPLNDHSNSAEVSEPNLIVAGTLVKGHLKYKY